MLKIPRPKLQWRATSTRSPRAIARATTNCAGCSASAIGKRELPHGIAVQIATERMALAQLAEWVSFERKCCPFFEFRIEVAPKSGPVWLSLTGRAGVKDFLAHAFAQ
ncbi:MAG: hypothetical protein WCA22_22470 [Candidatus Binatus sp.]